MRVLYALLIFSAIASQTTIYNAELTSFELGTRLPNYTDDIGMEYYNEADEEKRPVEALDTDLSTAYALDSGESIKMSLPKYKHRTIYPVEGFYLSNGDSEGKGMISQLEVKVRYKSFKRTWVFNMKEAREWQYLRFPEPFWLGRKGQLIISPLATFDGTGQGYITELAIQLE